MKIKEFKAELKQLLEKYNCTLEITLEGDFFGVYGEGLIIRDNNTQKSYTLTENQFCLDINDL